MDIEITQSIFAEIAEFIVSQPSLEDIAAYRVSSGVQHHLDGLLEKNRETGLTQEEQLQMEKMLAVSHLMTLAKAKAKLKLAGKA